MLNPELWLSSCAWMCVPVSPRASDDMQAVECNRSRQTFAFTTLSGPCLFSESARESVEVNTCLPSATPRRRFCFFFFSADVIRRLRFTQSEWRADKPKKANSRRHTAEHLSTLDKENVPITYSNGLPDLCCLCSKQCVHVPSRHYSYVNLSLAQMRPKGLHDRFYFPAECKFRALLFVACGKKKKDKNHKCWTLFDKECITCSVEIRPHSGKSVHMCKKKTTKILLEC